MLHEATAGPLRDIDRVAAPALCSGGRKKLKHVDVELLKDVLDAHTLLD